MALHDHKKCKQNVGRLTRRGNMHRPIFRLNAVVAKFGTAAW
jgi:hypothetical protein